MGMTMKPKLTITPAYDSVTLNREDVMQACVEFVERITGRTVNRIGPDQQPDITLSFDTEGVGSVGSVYLAPVGCEPRPDDRPASDIPGMDNWVG